MCAYIKIFYFCLCLRDRSECRVGCPILDRPKRVSRSAHLSNNTQFCAVVVVQFLRVIPMLFISSADRCLKKTTAIFVEGRPCIVRRQESLALLVTRGGG